MTDWLTNVLAVIGALWLVCAVALGMFAVACWAAGVMDRNEKRRLAQDAADYLASLDAMDADETRRWREWAGPPDAGFLFASPEFRDSSPIYTEVLVEQMRRDLAEWGKGDVA
jgi:hypothetical protein